VDNGQIDFVGTPTEYAAVYGAQAPVDPVGTVLPGLIDLHCHGGGGAVVTTHVADEAAEVAVHHRRHGTTSLLASLVTAAADDLVKQVSALAPLVRDGIFLGVHVEGPFLSERRRGAQAAQHLVAPDVRIVHRLLNAAEGSLRVMTLAPELPDALAVVSVLRAAGVVVALGHSDADHATFAAALAALDGSALVTHLANGMPALHHRAPGPVGAALTAAARGEATVELIADGVHLDDAFVELVFATASPGHVALVTDAMAAAGVSDGDYELGPQRVAVRDGVARLAPPDEGDPDTLTEADATAAIAGGTAHLLDVVRRTAATPVGLVEAVRAASSTPARVLGLDAQIGSLSSGKRADVLVVDEALQLQRVMVGGSWQR
jgi:N-acetylglucosamine-6-phosphate deacetylase